MRRLSAVALSLVVLAPALVGGGAALGLHDDAGSGRDAPSSLVADIVLERGRVYDANATGTDDDVYALDVGSGAKLEFAHTGQFCLEVYGPDLAPRAGTCSIAAVGRLQRYVVDAHGLWFVRIRGEWMPGPYRVAFEVDGAAPALVTVPGLASRVPLLGEAPGGDAGSGRDAPERPGADAVRIEHGRAYDAAASSLADVDAYVFEGRAGAYLELTHTATGGCWRLLDPDGGSFDIDCPLGAPVVSQRALLDRDGAWSLVMPGPHVGAYRFSLGLQEFAPPLVGPEGNPRREAPAPWAGAAPGCAGDASTPSFGSGDARVPTLRWAALKEGGRVVVAWEAGVGQTGELVYRVGDGEPQVVRRLVHQRAHAFVVDGLPVGETFCFHVVAGGGKSQWHPVRLANAHNAYDEASGTYTINLLVDATETPASGGLVVAGLGDFARGLWDATDGHVRAGALVVLQGEPREVGPGFYSCFDAALVLGTLDACHGAADVVVTHDMWPLAAGVTRKDGIRDPRGAIHLHAALMGTTPLDDLGNVLLHELGHYAFGMMDLYGGGVTGSVEGDANPGCVDRRWDISVMDSARDVTEFDDEHARCPNEAWIEGYVPSWTLLRERYPRIPDRPAGPLPGPWGDGGIVDIGRVGLAPAIDIYPSQDDAGSGHDAPDAPDGSLAIPLGVTLRGEAMPYFDRADHYAFDAAAGARLTARITGRLCAIDFVDPNGRVAQSAACRGGVTDNEQVLEHVARVGGTWHLQVNTYHASPEYAFRIDAASS